MRRALLGAVAAVLLATAPVRTASASACPALDYQADVAAAATAVSATPPDLATARTRVDAAMAIGGGSVLGPVRDDLAAVPVAVDDAGQRLQAIAAALAYPPGATCNEDTAPARSQLHDVYAGPDFRQLDAGRNTSLVQEILNAIGNLISRLSGFFGLGGALAVLAVVTAVVAVLVARRVAHSRGEHASVAPDSLPLGDDPAAEWRLALAAAQRDDHREAVRRAFRSTLLEVARRSPSRLDPSWTTRELLARLEVPAHVVVALAAAASSFDRAWYSGAPVSGADWDTARSRCEAVRAALRARVETTA